MDESHVSIPVEGVHAMDVDKPEIAPPTATQPIETQEGQPRVEIIPDTISKEADQPERTLVVATATENVSEVTVGPEEQAAVVMEQETASAVANDHEASLDVPNIAGQVVPEPQVNASGIVGQPLAEPVTRDEESGVSNVPFLAAKPVAVPIFESSANAPIVAEQSPGKVANGDEGPTATSDVRAADDGNEPRSRSPPPDLEPPVQEDQQDIQISIEDTYRDLTSPSGSNMDNQQVLTALNNALAYRDSQDCPEEEPQEQVLFLQHDESELPEASGPLGSALWTFTEDSTLTSLGPHDGIMSAGLDGLSEFPAVSCATPGEPDEEGLMDYSTPHSRFAGVFLPIVPDRRKLRYYVPAPEVKNPPSSLKITIKRPDGWTPRALPPVEVPPQVETFTSSGRKTRRPQKSYYGDMSILDQRRTALSQNRKGKQRDTKTEVSTHSEAPTSWDRKVSESVDYTIPAEEDSPQDQEVSDHYSNTDSGSEDRKPRKRETVEPSRRSRRIPEKAEHAHWSGLEDDEVSLEICRKYKTPSLTFCSVRWTVRISPLRMSHFQYTALTNAFHTSTNHSKPRQRRAVVLQDDGEVDELARSYSEDSMQLSEEMQSRRKRSLGRKGGKGKDKRVIESDEDFEPVRSVEPSESVHSIDEDVLTYHREVRFLTLPFQTTADNALSQLCDKCFRPSAKELGKARKKKGRGRKRKMEEFEEGSGDEAERLMGWIECEKCTVAFHWVGPDAGSGCPDVN